MIRKVFISAVSRELKSYRLLVEQWLQKRGYTPVFQELFELTDQEIVELLRDKLSDCDAVICLIGQRYGAEPSQPLDGYGRRSFTQLEYFFTRARTDRRIPIYRFLTTDATPVDNPNDETDELRQLQEDFRVEVTRDRNWRAFNHALELRAEIAELPLPVLATRKPCNLPPSSGSDVLGSLERATSRPKSVSREPNAASVV